MHTERVIRIFGALLVIGALFVQLLPAAAAAPSSSAFRRVWERTDKPVAELQATRTWIWGPEAFSGGLLEDYAEGPDGRREVQYFDKSRMELTHPGGDPTSAFYVTNGLLVVELITGRMQFGDATFEQFAPSSVNVAGDFDDANGPTYATFAELLAAPPAAVGSAVVQRLHRSGQVSDDPDLTGQGIAIAYVDEHTNHTTAAPFWEFMNSSGVIYEGGQLTTGPLFANPFFATGRPISEPYWADVKVGGVVKLVLMQCFERRCLTYTPDNAPEWRVEAGNVGQHYYSWRYEAQGMTPQPKPAPQIPTEATWSLLQPGGPTPSARRDHVLVADAAGQRVYLHGGRSGGVLSDLWVYDVAANSWTQLAPGGGPPAARFGHNGAFDSVNQRLLIFGGQAGSTFYSDLWAYDIATNSWQLLAASNAGPLDRYGGGGAFDPVTGGFYISHGFTSSGRFDDTWRFDVSGGSWGNVSAAGPRPQPRCLMRIVADPARGRLLLFGGQSNTASYLGDLWAFNLAGRGWQQLDAPGPSPRNFYAMTLAGDGNYLLLQGGNAGGSASSELWLLDLTSDQWTLLPATGQAPPSRTGHDMVWLAGQNTALIFGGDSAELWRVTFD